MPCNLKAVQNGKVSNEMFAKMLTPQVVEIALRNFAQTQGLRGEIVVRAYDSYNEVQLHVGDVALSVQVGMEYGERKPGVIHCTVGSDNGRGNYAHLLPLLQRHMLQYASVLTQERIKAALTSKFDVRQAVRNPQNGAMVIRVAMKSQ